MSKSKKETKKEVKYFTKEDISTLFGLMFNNEDINIIVKNNRKLLLELICNEQVHMIIKDNTKYESDKYKKLEELKIKVNAIKTNKSCENCACIECANNEDAYEPCENCKICSKSDGIERWKSKDVECFSKLR